MGLWGAEGLSSVDACEIISEGCRPAWSIPSWHAFPTCEAKMCIEFLHIRMEMCPLVLSGDLK